MIGLTSTYTSKNQLDAIALTRQAMNRRDLISNHTVRLLTRATALDPTLDLRRFALFRIIHKSGLLKNLENPAVAVDLQH